jgi:hypothetical protein
MNYRLIQKSINKAVATFHVLNAKDDIVGSVNVPPSEISDLMRHWNGARTTEAKQLPVARINLKMTKVARAAVLRGCN